MRDFVYVKEVVDGGLFLMHHRRNSGIYNLGSGKARTFLDLAKNTFYALDLEPQIDFIDTPVDELSADMPPVSTDISSTVSELNA